MRTLAHLSDLHFGLVDVTAAAALRSELLAGPPDLVVISGDLTQRARAPQFAAARAFIDALPGPRLILPGNHDIPLFHLWRRFLYPLEHYKRHIDSDLNPRYVDDSLCVVGVNTTRATTWQSGKISPTQLEHACREFSHAGPRCRILVTHHPFIPVPSPRPRRNHLARAERALTALARAGCDVLLAGHFHHAYAGNAAARIDTTHAPILSIQAGTAISCRTRSQPNSYNWITIDERWIELEVRVWNGHRFDPQPRTRFGRARHEIVGA